jgi:hypothetical protein
MRIFVLLTLLVSALSSPWAPLGFAAIRRMTHHRRSKEAPDTDVIDCNKEYTAWLRSQKGHWLLRVDQTQFGIEKCGKWVLPKR